MENREIQNFKRKEKKYLLTPDEYETLMQEFAPHIKPANYANSIISNVYYDTEEFSLINRSIEKPLYKEKLRIRAYLQDNWDKSVFVEMKKKYNGIVYKRRISADYNSVIDFLNTASEDSSDKACKQLFLKHSFSKVKYQDEQIANELAWMVHRYNLKPKLWLGYKRASYAAKDDEYLRITFDTNIIYRTEYLDLGLYEGKELFDFPYYLMEIKTPAGVPLWLAEALSKNKIYPYSFSKCGRVYKDKIFNNYIMEE